MSYHLRSTIKMQPEDDFFTPAARTMRSPVAVEPVMEILRRRGSATSASPRVPPGPVRTESTPLREAGVDEADGLGQRG